MKVITHKLKNSIKILPIVKLKILKVLREMSCQMALPNRSVALISSLSLPKHKVARRRFKIYLMIKVLITTTLLKYKINHNKLIH